ncbi:MAG: hypothetical protein ITG02_14290 [Patulibacter sp.]|nr:hypothetical protein [Patulibacter sp.]
MAVGVATAVVGGLAIGVVPAIVGADTLSSKVEIVANLPKGAQPTKRKPVPVTVDVLMEWDRSTNDNATTLQKTTVLFPKGSIYRGAKLPKCTFEALNNGGVDACPKGSVMGKGKASAFADTVRTTANITVVNGGKDRVFFYTTMTNPAVVQLPVEGKIRKLRGKWAYELVAEVPPDLQVVAGTPIVVYKMQVKITNKKWLALDRPPSGISVTNLLGPPRSS